MMGVWSRSSLACLVPHLIILRQVIQPQADGTCSPSWLHNSDGGTASDKRVWVKCEANSWGSS